MRPQFIKQGNVYKLDPQVVELTNELPAGIYSIIQDDAGTIYAKSMEVKTDLLLDLPDTITTKVLGEIEEFWQPEVRERFKRRNKVYKRGVLLYGAPGVGKTASVIRVSQEMVKRGGIVLFNTRPHLVKQAVDSFRLLNPEAPVLVTWEEFDEYCDSAETLTLLDGQAQLDNVTYLATTNYIDDIPDRIKKRSRRFASVIEVTNPNKQARKMYFTKNLFEDEQHLADELAEATEGFNFDGMSEMIIDVFCLGMSIGDAKEKVASVNITQDNEDTEYELADAKEKALKSKKMKAINDEINSLYDKMNKNLLRG